MAILGTVYIYVRFLEFSGAACLPLTGFLGANMLPTLASLAMDLKASTALRVPGGFHPVGDVVVFGGKPMANCHIFQN